jgi:hypothetical protein
VVWCFDLSPISPDLSKIIITSVMQIIERLIGKIARVALTFMAPKGAEIRGTSLIYKEVPTQHTL